MLAMQCIFEAYAVVDCHLVRPAGQQCPVRRAGTGVLFGCFILTEEHLALRFALSMLIGAILVLGASRDCHAQERPKATPDADLQYPEEAPSIPEASKRAQKFPAAPVFEKKQEIETIKVNAQRATVIDERRESTAAKLIVGRDEIEKFADSALVDVLRRLPGITVSNSGAVSLRGMGAGFTQILIDGERVAPGFSIEQISPEQVERIEILRAPTAETGARAIAGTINIILRKPLRKKQDDVKAGAQTYRGRVSEDLSFSRSDALGPASTYSLTLTARGGLSTEESESRVTSVNTLINSLDRDQHNVSASKNKTWNVTLNSQFQWKWGEGEQFMIQPFMSTSQFIHAERNTLVQLVGASPPPYAISDGLFTGHFSSARFTGTLNRHYDDDTRYELRGGAGRVNRRLEFGDNQFDANRLQVRLQSTDNRSNDISWNASAKLIHSFSETHKFIGGAEIEGVQRVDRAVTLLNGVPQLAAFGSELDISTRRQALYMQDEWDPAKNWSANVGARWEGIDTRSNVATSADGGSVHNRSSIFSPLAHVVWRFNAPKKDQIRLSLTQSYQSPSLFNLVPRPRLDATYAVPGPNTSSNADYAGNPDLKPERANGIDLAFEHYPVSGGVVSVNFFSRRIKDLVRAVILLESVSWATSPRYVYRRRNIGSAIASGIEFDAKMKLNEIIDGAIAVDLRANVSLFASRVDSVHGPNNRLNEQPRGKGNFGADYHFRDTALTLGGTVSYTPAYAIQDTDTQLSDNSATRTIDAYALWSVSPTSKVRLTLSNLAPRDSQNSTAILTGGHLQTRANSSRSNATVALRFEIRL